VPRSSANITASVISLTSGIIHIYRHFPEYTNYMQLVNLKPFPHSDALPQPMHHCSNATDNDSGHKCATVHVRSQMHCYRYRHFQH